MPGNFRAGLEKNCVARKPGLIFQSPESFKNKSNFLIFMGILTKFDKYMHQKSANFVHFFFFFYAKYKNLKPIFAAARKNSF